MCPQWNHGSLVCIWVGTWLCHWHPWGPRERGVASEGQGRETRAAALRVGHTCQFCQPRGWMAVSHVPDADHRSSSQIEGPPERVTGHPRRVSVKSGAKGQGRWAAGRTQCAAALQTSCMWREGSSFNICQPGEHKASHNRARWSRISIPAFPPSPCYTPEGAGSGVSILGGEESREKKIVTPFPWRWQSACNSVPVGQSGKGSHTWRVVDVLSYILEWVSSVTSLGLCVCYLKWPRTFFNLCVY